MVKYSLNDNFLMEKIKHLKTKSLNMEPITMVENF